ncbi:uncharacterized protein I303_102474 [Kwoniella dejecticola CBS 10117]|uniref:Malate dehydrogenase n=1 Tax=Kwoniella dejecticola CBS 10117 TaxID=1296121 RepID=A0A1A6A8V8_9TREE|nr:uncharacterized protein I303_02489 [Kwoniella dejecticola CBS 10117]OBR86482.1 hypothetical protein I303_02489 [Kwoniella dejecticola CBS 10117]
MIFTIILSLIILSPAVLSAPVAAALDVKSLASISRTNLQTLASRLPQRCSVSNISVPLEGQAGLAVPAGQTVSTIAVGRGVQNYTCTSGAYVSAGALANLFDVSCLFSMSSGFVDPQTVSGILPKMAFSSLSFPDAGRLPVAIHHQFVTTPGSATPGAISPEFATTADKVVVSKVAAAADPTDSAVNVPWLQLAAVEGQGTLSKSVFRLNTFNGQPPSSCTEEGEQLSVQYASMYWFTS